jgi:uncharacterized membrane protein
MKKIVTIAVIAILLIPAVYLAIVWKQVPPQVTMHFDIEGKPDRLGTRNELMTMTFILIGISALVYLLLTNIYRIDPKKYASENKSRLKKLGLGLVVFMSALQCLIIYSSTHDNISIGLMLPGMGLFFAFIGNYMPNIKPNYFAGFRLPWTLENEDNWKKTHILVGKLWFAGGIFLAIACLFLPSKPAFILFVSVMLIITIIPIIYSYRLFLDQKRSSKTPQ